MRRRAARRYRFFLAGLAPLPADFDLLADFAPALADDDFAAGLEAAPLAAFDAVFGAGLATGFAGGLTAGLTGAGGATFTGGGAGIGAAATVGFTTGRGPPVRSENAPGR